MTMSNLRVQLRSPDVSGIDPDEPAGEDSLFGLDFAEDDASVVILPVPWEVTTSYGRGTQHGPAAIRAASVQIDLYDPQLRALGLAHPWAYGIHMGEFCPQLAKSHGLLCELACRVIADGADSSLLAQINAGCRELQDWVYQQVSHRLDRGQIVGILGGDHSVPLGALMAVGERLPGGFGVLHIDAHADLRVAYEGFAQSHASIMDNALRQVPNLQRLVQVGIRDLGEAEAARIDREPRVDTFFAHDLHRRLFRGESWHAVVGEIVDKLPRDVYVSFDIDGLDPSYCPNTGTPVPGGLRYEHVTELLVELVASGRRVVGFDLVEVAPPPTFPAPGWDEWDANVGARLLMKLCGVALASHGASDRHTALDAGKNSKHR